jgi:UDP-N-acetylmuramoyl-L-alanyl-D-glutamate--2,6-diaminopimelate ligase
MKVNMIDSVLSKTRSFIPESVFGFFNPAYHWLLAVAGAVVYRFPARKIKVVAVTGTKGKSSTVEILNSILERAGFKTALTNTIRFKIGDDSRKNLYKMSMPGRFFMQKFLRNAVSAGCDYAILEMTSQGAALFRHKYIDLDAFVLTNISPEHIEAHGSYDKYVAAKLAIIRDGLALSKKSPRVAIVNSDDAEGARFLGQVANKKVEQACLLVRQVKYSAKNAEPYKIRDVGIDFTWNGAVAHSPLSGLFNLYNILAAATTAKSLGVSDEVILQAVAKFADIPGRVQKIQVGQDFTVVVDYAHTIDSLEKLYRVFRPDPAAPRTKKLIAVLGGTGGGRDNWKRAEMGKIADTYCDVVILTNEDPYDETPEKIVADVKQGLTLKKPIVIMDRRLAIREAIKLAKTGDTILITGKGTDPFIMGQNGTKNPWSDAKIAVEELALQIKGLEK